MAKRLDRLEQRINAAMRRTGDDPLKRARKHHLLAKLYKTPGGLLLAWLTPGLPPPGPFG